MEPDRIDADALPTTLDNRIDRLLDGDASEAEWRDFVGCADRHAALWRELACRQRETAMLGRAVARRVARAATCELPVEASTSATRSDVGATKPSARRGVRRHLEGLGWSAAALIALGWGLSAALRTPAPPETVIHHASLVGPDAPSDAYLDAYMDLGKREGIVVGELPTKLLLEHRALETGDGFEVLFVRPIVERRVVPSMYAVAGLDGYGTPIIRPVVDR